MEIKEIKGAVHVDDRGEVGFVNDFDFDGVKRFYTIRNHRVGFVRAWHALSRNPKNYPYMPVFGIISRSRD